MKTKKILKSSMSVALALTIPSVTASAWPSSHSNIAKADFGDTQATKSTKKELKTLIEKIFSDENITNRYLGTSFFHKTSNFPYYHVSFENHSVPDDVIDTTPWYNMWSEAATAKTKLEANSYTEKTAQNAIRTLKYYTELYNFDVNHDLPTDGFYKITDFKTPSMVRVDGDGQQDFYRKVVDNKEEIKNLFKESLIGVYKQGQDIEINLVANPDKVSRINGFYVNKVSSIDPTVNIGPNPQEQRLVAFSIPGELKAEQLVVTNMIYLDKNGVKQETGPFALDINYKAAKADNEQIPKYKEKLNEKIQHWIDRGNKVNEWLLTKENNSDNTTDFSQRKTISDAVTKLQELKRSDDANYDKLYKIATPIHEVEDVATLREVLDIKVAKLLEFFDLYTENVYTKESIKQYRDYIESVPKLKNTRNIKELVQLIKAFDNATFTYLKFNTDELKRIIEIAKSKNKEDYEPVSLEKFTQALNHAEDWIKQTESYRPQINDTSDQVKALTEAINGLVKKTGEKGEQVPPKEKTKKQEAVPAYSVPAKFVERGSTKPYGLYGRDYSQVIKSASVTELGNGKNEVILTLEPTTTNYGSTDIAPIGKIQYNKSGTISDAEVLETATTDDGITYPKKVKLLVYSDQKNVALEGLTFKDSFALGRNLDEPIDLYLDYSAKSETKEEKIDPLKEALQNKLNYISSDEITKNYNLIPTSLKTALNQLIPQVKNIINKNELDKDEATKYLTLISEQINKLDALSNLYQALEATKDTYNNFWKENTHYTTESKTLVKEKLDKLEKTIKDLDASDIEGEKETFIDEHDKEGTTVVYKKIDELTGNLQHLGDYLRVDTTALSDEITKAEKALSAAKNSVAKQTLRQLIDEAKRYVEHSKLTPDSADTDDQVNTDLTDYYTEQFKFAIKDLDNPSTPNESTSVKEELSTKINEVSLVKAGKKEPAAFVNLTNELTKAKEILNNSSSDEAAYLNALNNLKNALNTFNNSKDIENQTPPTIDKPSTNNNETSSKRVELEGAFKKTDLSGLSTMNSVLKSAYLVTENAKRYIELELQPMLGDKDQAIGVLSKLTTFEKNTRKEHDVEVLATKTIKITFGNETKEYEYPSKVRIPVDGKPESIRVNTFAGSTVFGTNKHENEAILTLRYPQEDTIISADKQQLKALFDATTHRYYETWTSVFRKANEPKDITIINDFGKKVNDAQTVLKNNTATNDEISQAFTKLFDVKNQYDLLIKLRNSNADTVASFNADKAGNNYSLESINTVDAYLQERIDKLEKLIHETPKSSEINGLFNDVQSYYNMLRLNTSKLDDDIKTAEEAISRENLNKETKNKVHLAINAAKDFINKAKETRNLEDKRKELSENLDKAVKALKVETAPNTEINKPSENNNGDTNKPTPGNNEGNKPSEKPTPTLPSSEENSVDKTILLIPLESAKILIASDELNPNINKKALAAYKDIVAKVQGAFDDPAASQEDINKATIDLGKALAEYLKAKENTSTNTNPNPTEKPGVNNTTPNNNTDDNKPNNGTNSTPSDNNTNNTPSVDTPTNQPSETSTPGDNITNNTTPSTNVQPNVVKQIFDDNNNGVEVELLGNSPAKKVSVDEVKDENLVKSISEKLNLTENNKVRILDLKLLDDNNEVVNSTANRTVAIILKDDEKDVAIYHIKDNGDLELINSSIEGNKVKFEIDHFSKFAIISNSKNDKQTPHQAGHKNNSDANSSNSTQNTASENNSTTANTITDGQKTLSKTGIQSTNLSTLGILALTLGGALLLIRRKNKN